MYCSTCELEIKGDDKQACPICGGTLTDGLDASVSNGKTPQEQSALHDIIEDINSLIDGPAPATSGPEQESVFVLKDYEEGSCAAQDSEQQFQAPAEPQLFAASFAKETEPPASDDVFPDADVSLQERLDTIKQSMAASDHPADDSAGAHSAPQEDDGVFSFPASFEPDGVLPDGSADGQASLISAFDGDESALISAHPPEHRLSPALLIALLVVLLGGLGYYGYRFVSAGKGPDEQPSTKRTVLPLAALKFEEEQQVRSGTGAAALSPDAGNAVPAVAAAGGQPQQDAEPVQKPAPPAEVLSGPAAVTPAPVAGTAVEPPGTASAPEPEKPVASSQAQPAAPSVVTAAPAPVSAAPEPSPAAAEPVKRVAPVTAPFYTLHVGSFRKQSVASSEAARIRAKGHDAFVERADLGQRGIWFRVKVGRFKTRAEAEALKLKINKVLVPDGIVVMNRAD